MSADTARRSFLQAAAATAVSPFALFAATAVETAPPGVCLALGSGGARGLAHVLMLDVLDELGIRPRRIAGSSIGAVMGVLYAAGLSARDIRGIIDTLTVSGDESWFDAVFSEDVVRWAEFVELTTRRGGLLEAAAFIDFLREKTGCERFEDLQIPLQVVATDFWSREQVVFDSGPLWPAVRASMTMPGLFAPVEYRGRILVDGGLVNPVPYDVFPGGCEITVAVDVLGTRTPQGSPIPSYFDTSFNTFQIMQASIVEAKLAHGRPDIFLRPDTRDVRVLEFYRFEEIFREARPEQARMRKELREQLGRRAARPHARAWG
jgi:NTE family protein